MVTDMVTDNVSSHRSDAPAENARTSKTGHTLVVIAHPLPESFVHAIAQTAVEARRSRGDSVDVLDLYADQFDPVLSVKDWHAKEDPLYATLIHTDYVNRLLAADSLVLVYPTWMGGQPAILKGWIDRIWAAGVAYHLPSNRARITRGLSHVRDLTVLSSHGSTKMINVLQGEPGKRLLKRGLRAMCSSRVRVRWLSFYGNDRASDIDRAEYLRKVRATMGRNRSTVSRWQFGRS